MYIYVLYDDKMQTHMSNTIEALFAYALSNVSYNSMKFHRKLYLTHCFHRVYCAQVPDVFK